MSEARRGELWLVDLGEPLGHEQGWHRPGLVVSDDEWNQHAQTLTVVPVTRTQRGLPTRIEIEATAASGLDATSYACCEDIRTLSAVRLIHRFGAVDDVLMLRVGRALRRFLAT